MPNKVKLLEELNVQAILIQNPHNFTFFSNLFAEGFVYISREKSVIITDGRYTEAAQAGKGADFSVIEYSAKKPLSDILNELIKKDGVKRLGFEDTYVSVATFEKFKKMLEGVEFCPVGNKINFLRKIKSPEETENIRKAEAIGDKAFSEILKVLKPGISEREVAMEIDYLMRKFGASGNSFDTIVASGKNSSMPHALFTDKKLMEGDFVTMDFGCIYNGYCSDMTRTVAIGKIDDEKRKVYEVVLNAQMTVLNALKEGVSPVEMHMLAANTMGEFSKYFTHGLGHGVGLEIHEWPRLSPSETDKMLCENMVVTVEPGIYIPGKFGVRIEDLVVIKKDGIDNLTGSPKNLMEIMQV